MKSKKTIDVAELLAYANTQLARKDDMATSEFKMGISCMIEKVLMLTGNYEGFAFLGFDDPEYNTMGYWSRIYYHNKNTDPRNLKATVKT